MRPTASIARETGASLSKDKCVRGAQHVTEMPLALKRTGRERRELDVGGMMLGRHNLSLARRRSRVTA
jgi:hypothetical protein